MKSKLLMLFLLFSALAFAQNEGRRILHGKVISENYPAGNISVLNTSSKIGAVTDENGRFTIYAKPADTLYFSSISFREAKLGLKKEHFEESQLLIELMVDVTVLDEVVIANVLSGQLEKDSKDTKTDKLNKDLDYENALKLEKLPVSKANVNGALPSNVTGSSLTGVNFTEVYKMIFKKKPAKKDRNEIYAVSGGKSFPESVRERFTYHFFTQTLKIPKDEIGLFLVFCDEDEKTAWMLDPRKEFELTDYLVVKSKEYLKREK